MVSKRGETDTKLEWNQLHRSERWGRRGLEELNRRKGEMRYRGGQGTAKLTYTVNSSILSIKITPEFKFFWKIIFSAHTILQTAQPQSLVTGCKCPNNTENNRHQGWLQQWSVPVLPVFIRKRQLLKCSCTLPITEILQSVTIIKSQGSVLSSQTGATQGRARLSQLFQWWAPPSLEEKKPAIGSPYWPRTE